MHVLIIASCAVFLTLAGRLFYLQIVRGQYYQDNYKLQILKTRNVQGTRGNIYDRNGELLAYNDLSYSVIFEDNITGSGRNEILNGILEEVIRIVESHGDRVAGGFGIVLDDSGRYSFLQKNETLRMRFVADVYGESFIEDLSAEQKNSSAEDIMRYLCTDEAYGYGIDPDNEKIPKEHILKLTGLRYAVNLNTYQKYIPATLAMDVSEGTAAEIMENLDSLPGVDIQEDSVRRYVDGKYFASVIGYTGQISREEYDALDKEEKEKYSLTDIVGKAGIEKTMETILRGTMGEKQYYVDSFGKVTDTLKTVESGTGGRVYLTLDKNLQKDAYDILEEKLAGILLDRLRNVMNYDPSYENSTRDIIIPADDAYNAFIANAIIDCSHFCAHDAHKAEREVYEAFSAKKKQVSEDVLKDIYDPGAAAFKDLSAEMKAYMEYVTDDVLYKQTGILMWESIDKTDEVYKKWRIDETISLNAYLRHAISKNWIDTSKLSEYLPEAKYLDSKEVFEDILAFLKKYLESDGDFDKLLYRYLIKSGGISGNQICAIVYEQGVLPMDEDAYQGLSSGSTDPFSWLCGKIRSLEITPGELALEPCTGSMVVSDPHSGEVLACVSYPGYDNNRMANAMDPKYFYRLVTGLSRPFYNNATQERTAPGSTFKMVTSLAGLTENVIDGGTLIECTGEFTKVKPSPKCWCYPGAHGSLDIVGALEVSCNDFFYEVGYDLSMDRDGEYNSALGIGRLRKYAKRLGLGKKSGLEIPESEPQISDEYPVLSAIGQGTNNYTTSQMNRCVSTVANKGTLYKLTLLKKTTDSDGKLIKNYEPVIEDRLTDIPSYTWDLIHQGMTAVVNSSPTFYGMDVSMAGKTGTAQQSDVHPDHVLFVGFAPADDPKIAVATRIANGYASTYTAEVGRDVVKSYFHLGQRSDYITGKAAQLGTAAAGD